MTVSAPPTIAQGHLDQLLDATCALAAVLPARSEERGALLEATAWLCKARTRLGSGFDLADCQDSLQALPPAVRLHLLREAWRRTALELLGPAGAATATYRLADAMVAAG